MKLKNCAYGLDDASRHRYLKVRKFKENNGFNVTRQDSCIFYLSVNNKLCGLVACHVDNFLWAGNERMEEVILFQKEYLVGSESSVKFTYSGSEIDKTDGINKLSQNQFIKDKIRENRYGSPKTTLKIRISKH